MSHKEDELPGFYRDPKTGKYYREPPGGASNLSLKKIKSERNDLECEKKAKPNEITNVLKFLRHREKGSIISVLAKKEYFKMRAETKELLESVSLNDEAPHNIVSVDFIKGGQESVFGMWSVGTSRHNASGYVVGEQNFLNYPNHQFAGFRLCRNYLIDVCEGPAETIICMFNNPFPLILAAFEYLPRVISLESRTSSSISGPYSSEPFFCCSSMHSGSQYAVGSDGFIKFFRGFDYEYCINVSGKVHALSFEEDANLMVAGVHHGILYIYDMRTKEKTGEVKVSNQCLMDSAFLDPWHVIVASVSNKLCKVDLRAKSVITDYFGHSQSTKKCPFSIVNDMLCATGTDNVVRIWHVSGGNPLHEIKPISSKNPIRGWLNGNCNETYLNYFEADYKKVFKLCKSTGHLNY